MNVLHICPGNLFGGVESMLLTLARSRDVCPACRPHFAVCYGRRLSSGLKALGVGVEVLGAVRVSRPWTVWQARRRLARMLARGRYDRVVCHSAWSQAVFGPAVRSGGVPLVFWLHDAATGRHWLERWARRTAPDLVICNSHYTAGTVPRLYPGVRTEVIYCPVAQAARSCNDTNSDRPTVRAELDTPDDCPVIIQVSRLEEWKGHALHLAALAGLGQAGPWACWIVGGAQRPHEVRYLKRLKDEAARLGIGGRVRFLGQRSDVRRLLAAADIFCQPNTGPEPFGIAFVEALAAGLPVVTTAMGGALEVVDPASGVLVAPDAGALACALGELVRDPRARARLAAGGPARARLLCDPEQQVRRLAGVLEDVPSYRVAG
jgi:glycosyltransferase involved in cell wall biosynthesis